MTDGTPIIAGALDDSRDKRGDAKARLPAIPRAAAGELALMAGVAVMFVLAWQFLPPLLGVPRYIIPVFTDCLAELLRMIRHEDLVRHLGSTLVVSIAGFLLGSLLGAACGYGL